MINGTTAATARPCTGRLGDRLCTRWPAVVALTALLAVPGCSTAIDGRAGAAPVAPTTAAPTGTRAPATPSAQATESVDPDAQLDAAAEQLRPFLLEAGEVGPGFTVGAEPEPDPSTPAICGGPGVVAQFPIAARIGAGFDGPDAGVFMQETVSVYGDVDTATQAYQATLDGLDCSEGDFNGETVVLTPAEDLSVDVPADRSTGWQIGGGDYDLILIAVRSGEVVMNFAFVAPVGQAAGLPDPLAVSRAGVEKLVG